MSNSFDYEQFKAVRPQLCDDEALGFHGFFSGST